MEHESSNEKKDSESQQWGHVPVLLGRTLELLDPGPGDVILDGTIGLGGHAEAILGRLGQSGVLIGVDRDEEALERARERLRSAGDRVRLVRGLFSQIREATTAAGVAPDGGLDGILLDLGVSSLQLDAPRRGFSFLKDGPLDMRMSGEGMSAADWLEGATVNEIETVLRELGEEPAARRIAKAIDQRRRRRPLRTTAELVEVVESVKPRGRGRVHAATLVFQAIRIRVNSELEQLGKFMSDVDRYLAPGGRLVVMSYHSLEDRIVKRAIRERVRDGIFESSSELIRPDEEEIRDNPRARSARLRQAVRRRAARARS